MEFWKSALSLELVVNTIPNGVFVMDQEGIIRSWNRHMEELMGYTSDEAIGLSCSLLACHGRTDEEWSGECPILGGKMDSVEAFECQVRAKNGDHVPVMRNAAVIKDSTGAMVGVIQSLTDLRPTRRLQTELTALRQVSKQSVDGKMVGKSSDMQKVYEQIRLAANSEATVLVLGETGTGKELAVEEIHRLSHRAKGPLVKINCSALPETLLESELFGHVKGAFTGAIRDKVGRFELADGGTIFLDEIGDISPLIQVKLLRILQERTIERLGENRVRQVDVRVVAATHRDLKKLVGQEVFREDLFYRLRVFPITIPPLRDRRSDLPMLVDHFINRFNKQTGKRVHGLSDDALRAIMDACWRGNVRELENSIEHAFVTCSGNLLELEDLPLEIRTPALRAADCQSRSITPDPGVTLASRRRRISSRDELIELLDECDWNRTAVADALGISRVTVWRKMKQWSIPLDGEA